MFRSVDRPAYSYRDDPDVPDIDDSRPIAFMDGDCVLCTAGARLIARLDRSEQIRICPVQTAIGGAVLAHYGMKTDDPDSWLFLEQGIAYEGIDAMIRVGQRVGGIGRLMTVFLILPGFVRDWLYRRVARNRYALFGRREMCMLPEPSLRARLME